MDEHDIADTICKTLKWAANQANLPALTGFAHESGSNKFEVEAGFGMGRFIVTVEGIET